MREEGEEGRGEGGGVRGVCVCERGGRGERGVKREG